MQLIVSTNSPITLVVVPAGCSTLALKPVPQQCVEDRGGVFNQSLSQSWVQQGTFSINNAPYGFEANLGYGMNAIYGLDTVGLGYVADINGPTLKNQTVAAYGMAKPFYE